MLLYFKEYVKYNLFIKHFEIFWKMKPRTRLGPNIPEHPEGTSNEYHYNNSMTSVQKNL